MIAYRKICALLALLLLCLSVSACTADGAPQPYSTGACTHSFSGTWYDVAPAEGEEVTEQVHYCRICHAAETRPKE